jgi:nucleoside-diphosphate-sugar epimerase
MKVLVTGGTGFIGSRVIDCLLAHGHHVRLFSRSAELPVNLAGEYVSLFSGDLRNPDSLLDAMVGTDVFYHIGEIRNTSIRAAQQNVRFVEYAIDHLAQAGVKRFVFISSLSVAGIPSRTPADEGTVPKITLEDHYTRHKERCEKLLAERIAGVEYTVIRPGVVYGPGSKYIGVLIDAIDRLGSIGIPFIGKGDHIAPLIHVRDLAQAVYLAGITKDAAGQVFNLTDGLRHSWSDFLNAIARALNKKLRILPFPPFLLGIPARFLDALTRPLGMQLSLNAYVQYVSTDLLFDNGKAQRLLNWKPEYTLAQGVEEIILEYRQRRGS